MRLLLLLTAATLGLACSSTSIEVGSYSVANAEDALGWTREEACASGKQLSIVGTWTGTRSELTPSGSDFVQLVITHANAKYVCGTLTFGRDGPEWPPVRDPDVGYPPDLAGTFQSSFEAYIATLEGVPRTLTGGAVETPRFDPADPTRRSQPIKFRASYGQWRSWCSLQTPYPCEGVPGPEYYCVPASGSGGLTPRVRYTEGRCFTDYGGAPHAVDCGKATLCFGGPCTCTSIRCGATPFWGSKYELTFQGDTAVGSGIALTRAR